MFKRWFLRRSTRQPRPDPFTLLGLHHPTAVKHQNPRTSYIDKSKPASSQNIENLSVASRGTLKHLHVIAAGLAVGAVLIVGGLAASHLNVIGGSSQEFAYFEVKALDPNGHPVAGALVREGDRRIGVTDSFGEWRRYMRVDLGKAITLSISKETPHGLLMATRNFAVPLTPPRNGDIEITGRVQLQNSNYVKVANLSSGTRSEHRQDQLPDTRAQLDQKPVGEELRKTIHISYDASYERQMSQEDRKRARYVRTGIIEALSAEARSAGFEPDPQSPWQVTLSHLPLAGENGFIIITSNRATTHATTDTAFIRNYLTGAQTTAARVFSVLQSIPEGGWQQRPPTSEWTRQNLRVNGNVAPGTYIFVGGFPAYQSRSGHWHYWGRNQQRANLTVVQNGVIIYRTQIVNSQQSPPLVSLPQLRMARP